MILADTCTSFLRCRSALRVGFEPRTSTSCAPLQGYLRLISTHTGILTGTGTYSYPHWCLDTVRVRLGTPDDNLHRRCLGMPSATLQYVWVPAGRQPTCLLVCVCLCARTYSGVGRGCRGERGCGRHVALGLQQTTDTTYTATYKRPGACNRSPDSARHVDTARALNRWRMAV